MKDFKKIQATINALIRFEIANLENKDFMKKSDEYIIATNGGYFWGFCRKFKDDFTKNEVEKIST